LSVHRETERIFVELGIYPMKIATARNGLS